jgi:hypothetical protein
MSAPLYPGRFTARNSESLVLFRIGMRFNGWRGIVPALQSFASMPFMLAEQRADPAIGMLWSTTSVSWPIIEVTQVWRTFDDLERYATMPHGRHTRMWRWFNKLGRSGLGTGIWHETFRVAAGAYEAIYVNMPRYGVAAATAHEPVAPARASARDRMDASSIPVA